MKSGIRFIYSGNTWFWRAAALATALAIVPAAQGAAEKYPRLEFAVPIEIENDWNYDSDSADNRHNQLYTLTEPEAMVRFTPELSFFVHAVLEVVEDPGPGEDRFFEDQGLFIEDLYLSYETDRFAAKVGKFTPNFGLGWDETPGVYGSGFAEAGYEFAERIGIAGSISFGGATTGVHRLEASTFFLDTTILAQSTLKGRGRVKLMAAWG